MWVFITSRYIYYQLTTFTHSHSVIRKIKFKNLTKDLSNHGDRYCTEACQNVLQCSRSCQKYSWDKIGPERCHCLQLRPESSRREHPEGKYTRETVDVDSIEDKHSTLSTEQGRLVKKKTWDRFNLLRREQLWLIWLIKFRQRSGRRWPTQEESEMHLYKCSSFRTGETVQLQ